MSLLLLFAYTTIAPSIPISELVETAPLPGVGYAIQRPASSGEWRFGLELADPTAGDSIVWHDITRYYAGDSYQRGADEYLGRYRAAVAQVQLQTDNDDLAPWGQDTSDLFGVNVLLDAGLLMRATMFRVDASVTVEWEPLWTGRVETWGDASAARGQIRTHVVTVTDTMADLANVPTIITDDGLVWSDWMSENLAFSSWLFGIDYYGDTGPETVHMFQDLNAAAAINRMDQAADPQGLVWRSRRNGRLIAYPAPWDTTNVARWPNPLLDVYPSGLVFSFSPDFTDIEYIADDDAQQFGIQRTSLGVLNSFQVTTPGSLFLEDDPVSQGRYGVRPYVTTWVANGIEQVVIDLLDARAYSSSQALPLRTTLDHEGFWSAMALIDHLDPVTIIHATTDDGLVVTAPGTVRNVTEDRTVRGEGDDGVMLMSWQSTVQVDITSTSAAPALLPVENLVLVQSNSPLFGGPSSAEFSWTNPTQPDITPTEVQYRVLGRSLIWNPKSYPGVGADGMTIGSLSAATTYTLQVRLVRRVAGIVTAFSASRQVTFTTPALIYPTPVPDGDSTNVSPTDDLPFDCVYEVELQENDGTGWTVTDTFTGAEVQPDGTLTYPVPNSTYENDKIYRFVRTEICGGDPGDPVIGTTFDPPDDWTDPCTDPPELLVPPYDDASLLVYVPKVCGPDTIEEAVSGIAGVHGPAFDGFVQTLGEPDRLALLAVADPAWSATPDGIIAYGECPQITGHNGDRTIGVFAGIANNDACTLFECGGMQITCAPGSGSNWLAGVSITTVDGVISLISGNIAVGPDGVNVSATFDADTGDVKLFVAGVLVDSDTFGAPTNTVVVLPIWRVGAPPESWVTDCALFDSVISTFSPPIIAGLELWYDAQDAATFSYSSGSVVSQWRDKSGHSRTLAPSSTPGSPTRNTTINGFTAVRFDATASPPQRLRGTAGATAMATSSGFTFFVVAKAATGGYPNQRIFEMTVGTGAGFSSPNAIPLFMVGSGTTLSAISRGTTSNATGSAGTTNPFLAGSRQGAGVVVARLNGSNSSSISASAPNDCASFWVATESGDSTAFFDGIIGEIILYSGALSDADRDAVETYLTNKWGL